MMPRCFRPLLAAFLLVGLALPGRILGQGQLQGQSLDLGLEEPPCTLVVGHGRNLAKNDPDANTAWNQVNNQFNAQVSGHLQNTGLRVVRLPLPVESRAMAANVANILDRAQDAGCDRVLETTIFADEEAHTLVVRLRAHPLVRVRNLFGGGALLNIGEPNFSSQRELPLEPRSFDRLAPDTLAREMAADFVRHLQGR